MAREPVFFSRSAVATEALGEALGRALPPGAFVALDGELGSGKTCFVRGLARGLGVREAVTSPTYALLQTYRGRVELAHLDAWMEGRERAFLMDGGLDSLDPDGVVVVEWADRVRDALPTTRIAVRLEHAGRDTRRIQFAVEGAGPPAAALARALEAACADVAKRAEATELAREEHTDGKDERDGAQERAPRPEVP
ncbi:MAG: tRNA (adenosine(37)-N6)-threonylcarbamoyltransferase complex ATPase subunit type 1 TsaE [Planctomycetes bacterium]|nr:tRNA (adenosine(37)-N6)-threonylcarbamoyltransferase complex ATPase subunit type 1 TsaE [Planctomycetota bacterium]